MASATRQTIPDLVDAGMAALPTHVRDYIEGGSETESAVRRNRAALDDLALIPRVLIDVANMDIGACVFGKMAALPVLVAPMGQVNLIMDAAPQAIARAVERIGTLAFVSVHSSVSIEDIRRAAPRARLALQTYPFLPELVNRRLINRATEAGYEAVCVTVDTPVFGRRERDIRNGFRAREGPQPNLRDVDWPHTGQAAATWADLTRIRDMTDLPLVVKGILSPADAVAAANLGANAIYVSNHGGRRLDHVHGTATVLPAIHAAVGGQVEILFDGGVSRGTDVLKAMALGADAVAIGRLVAWALAAAGEEGLRVLFDLLLEELRTAAALLGVPKLADINQSFVGRVVESGSRA